MSRSEIVRSVAGLLFDLQELGWDESQRAEFGELLVLCNDRMLEDARLLASDGNV